MVSKDVRMQIELDVACQLLATAIKNNHEAVSRFQERDITLKKRWYILKYQKSKSGRYK